MPPETTDFTAMEPGQVLLRTRGFVQAVEVCPSCGRPGKPVAAPGGRQFVHVARVVGETYTATVDACLVPGTWTCAQARCRAICRSDGSRAVEPARAG